MSKVAIQGAATGTGVFTLASPATNTDRTLTLPDEAGTVLTRAAGSPDNSVVVDASGNVGIGTSSPTYKVDVSNADNTLLRLNNSTGVVVKTLWEDLATRQGEIALNTGDFLFSTGTGSVTERMRLTSGGNLLVGKTAVDNGATVGIEIRGSDSKLYVTDLNSTPFALNRLGSDGQIMQFSKDGVQVGSIGTSSNAVLFIGTTAGSDAVLGFTSNLLFPSDTSGGNRDNIIDLGRSSARWDDIYATNGTIQTSDRNEKQDIETLSEAEARVAVACKGLLRKFRWKDSVAEKGDEARIHFGIIAQDLQDAFAAEGLDAGRYAMFISSTWTDEETGEERTRLGVRYPELLAFIIGAI